MLFGARADNEDRTNNRSLATRINQLEKKLKKQEADMAKYMTQARGSRRHTQSMDVKKEFEQAVWRFCEEQKRGHGQIMVKNVHMEGPATERDLTGLESPVRRMTTTFKVSSSP